MLIYEVNLEVEPSVAALFEEWLHTHIEEVLKCRGFLQALFRRGERTCMSGIRGSPV